MNLINYWKPEKRQLSDMSKPQVHKKETSIYNEVEHFIVIIRTAPGSQSNTAFKRETFSAKIWKKAGCQVTLRDSQLTI